MLKRIAQVLLGLALVVLVIWFASPWWVQPLVRSFAADAGFSQVSLDTSRPTPQGIFISRLEVTSGEFHIIAHDLEIEWSVASLRSNRIESLAVGDLTIQQSSSAAAPEADGSALDSAFIPSLPVDDVDAPRVVFLAPHLPLRLEGSVELAEKRIDLEFKAVESPADVPVGIALSLDESGEFLARLHTSADENVHAFEARGAIRGGVLAIDGALNLGDYELGLLTGLTGLTPMGGTLTGPITATFDDAFNVQTLNIEPMVALQAISEQGRKRRFSLRGTVSYEQTTDLGVVKVDLTDTSKSQATRVNLTAQLTAASVHVEGNWNLSRSDFSSLTALMDLPELEGQAGGDVKIESPLPFDLAAVELDATTELDLDYAPGTDVAIRKAQLRHAAAEPWSFELTQFDFQQDEDGVKITFVAPRVEGEVLLEESPTLRFTTDGNATWADESMKVTLEGLKASGTGQLTPDGWQGQLALTHRGYQVAVDLKADESFDRIDYTAPLDLTLREPLLATTLKSPADYDVLAGHFAGSLQGRMQGDDLDVEVQGTFNRGRLRYGDYEASDVSAEVNYRLNADQSTALNAQAIHAGKFDPGVPITNIRTAIRMNDEVAEVATVTASLLGGTFQTTPFTYALEAGTGAFEVSLRGLDLGAVLALEGEDLNGTGTLEGILPIVLAAEGVVVNKGTLRTTGPGVIRIAPSLTRVMEQPGLDFVLKALEDFSYSSLEADVDYNVTGDLLAAIRLKGHNPAIEKGRPIHYNLNVSENIPSLLASLRIQDDVNERIERRVRERAGLPK